MSDLRGGLEGAGFHQSGAEQQETSETAERQRLLGLLSNPANRFRLESDYFYQSDSRLNPQSPDHKPVDQVLLEDWEEFVKDQRTDKISEAELEQEWLAPLSREAMETTLQGWIDTATKPEEKSDRAAYKERFLASVDSYDRQQKAAQEMAKTPVSANSRLYRDYAGEYFNNGSGLQDRFANVKDYLRAVLAEMQNRSLSLPEGCKSANEVLSPFWQTDGVETKNHNRVFLGSRLGLEYGMRFYDNPESTLLSHVAGNLSEKRKKFSGSELESVSLGDKFGSLRNFIKQAAERLEAGEINLPDGAENLAEALRPLSEQELDEWFDEQGIDKNHPFRKFLSTGVTATEQLPSDVDAEVGTNEDLAHHQQRWQNHALRPVSYRPPLDSGNVDVPQGVAKDFGYKEGLVGSEGRAFRAEAAANLRDLKFEPLRQDGVLRMSCMVDINDQGTLRPRRLDIYVNLSKEAVTAYGENPSAVQQVLADLLQANESAKHPDLKYNPQADRLEIGLGDDEHLNVIISMSTADLRAVVPQMAGEVNDYVARKQAVRLAPDERQKMWGFENELLKTWQENSNGQRVELRQKIWDDAFLKLFRQRVGEQKFAELAALQPQPISSPSLARQETRPQAGGRTSAPMEARRVTSRLREAREIMDTPEMQQKATKFLEAIKSKYGGWEEFLQYAGNVLDIAHRKEVDLNSAPAYVILGREILGMPERVEGLKDYEKLSRLSLDEIIRQNLSSLPEGAKVNKPNILRYALYKNIKENPLPSDTWDRAGLDRSASAGRTSADAVRPPRSANPERQPARVGPSDNLRKISARNQKRLDRRPYNPDYDPEVQAGII